MSFEDWVAEKSKDHPDRFLPDVITVYNQAYYSAKKLNGLMKMSFYADADYGDYARRETR